VRLLFVTVLFQSLFRSRICSSKELCWVLPSGIHFLDMFKIDNFEPAVFADDLNVFKGYPTGTLSEDIYADLHASQERARMSGERPTMLYLKSRRSILLCYTRDLVKGRLSDC